LRSDAISLSRVTLLQVISRTPIGESVPDKEEKDTKTFYSVVGTVSSPTYEPLIGVDAVALV
jgi:hypothetical protein